MRGFPFRPDVFADPLVQVTAVAIGALVSGDRGHRPPPASPRLSRGSRCCCSPASSHRCWRASRRPGNPRPWPREIPRCEMVAARVQCELSDDKPVLGISLTPSTPTPPDKDTHWDFAASAARGATRCRCARAAIRAASPSHYLPGQFSRGIEAALRRHLGPGWAIVSDFGSWRGPGAHLRRAFARSPRIPDGPGPGRHLALRSSLFLALRRRTPVHPRQQRPRRRRHLDLRPVRARPVGPARVLPPPRRAGTLARSARTPRAFEDRGHCVRRARPRAEPAHHPSPTPSPADLCSARAPPARAADCCCDLDGGSETRDFAAGDPIPAAAARSCVRAMRARSSARWTSPSPVDLPTPRRDSSGSGLANDVRDLKPADIARWIDANPPPPADRSPTPRSSPTWSRCSSRPTAAGISAKNTRRSQPWRPTCPTTSTCCCARWMPCTWTSMPRGTCCSTPSSPAWSTGNSPKSSTSYPTAHRFSG